MQNSMTVPSALEQMQSCFGIICYRLNLSTTPGLSVINFIICKYTSKHDIIHLNLGKRHVHSRFLDCQFGFGLLRVLRIIVLVITVPVTAVPPGTLKNTPIQNMRHQCLFLKKNRLDAFHSWRILLLCFGSFHTTEYAWAHLIDIRPIR